MAGFHDLVASRFVLAITSIHFNAVSAQNAEAYYVDNIAALVQESCINCHYSGGIGPRLKFTGSSSANHKQFANYVNNPTPGRALTESSRK